jgi:hypothetical protein
MHARKPTHVPIIKGNGFMNFNVSSGNMEYINEYGTICFSCWKLNECTSIVLPWFSSRIRVVLAVSNLDIDHWNGVTNVGVMQKERTSALKDCEYKDRTLWSVQWNPQLSLTFTLGVFVWKSSKQEVIINVIQRYNIAWYETKENEKWLREIVPKINNGNNSNHSNSSLLGNGSSVLPNTLTQSYTL